jgi:hypothetical protein
MFQSHFVSQGDSGTRVQKSVRSTTLELVKKVILFGPF